MGGAAETVFLPPAEFVRIAGSAAPHLESREPRANTRAGWPPITTRTSTSSASCFPNVCTRISTTSTPIAAGRTTWATRSATPPRACACSSGGAANWTRCTRAAPRTRCSSRCCPPLRSTAIPRQPFADLIDAFVQDQTVTRYRNWDELFGYCRCSANPVGRLVLYLAGIR